MIKYELKYINPYNDDREVLSFRILEPYQELSIIQGVTNIEDLDLEIKAIEQLIERTIPDYSEDGGILYQAILWGSEKSKIAEYVDDIIVGGQEFNTKEFLKVCLVWRDFLKKNSQ